MGNEPKYSTLNHLGRVYHLNTLSSGLAPGDLNYTHTSPYLTSRQPSMPFIMIFIYFSPCIVPVFLAVCCLVCCNVSF